MDAHHVLPVKFESRFNEIGINIHDPKYGVWIERTQHRIDSNNYNKEWEAFFKEKNHTVEDVESNLIKLSKKYNFELNL